MRFSCLPTFLFFAAVNAHSLTHLRSNSSNNLNEDYVKSTKSHRHQTEPCVLMEVNGIDEDYKHVEQVECYEPSTGYSFNIVGIDEDKILALMNSGEFTSGRTSLMQEGAYYVEETASLHLISEKIDDIKFGEYIAQEGEELEASDNEVFGPREVLAVRIVANDATVKYSESEMYTNHYNDPVCLKTQMEACSYNKVQIIPTKKIPNAEYEGVYTLTLDMNIIGTERGAIKNAAMKELSAQFGGKVDKLFDHTMICVPAGSKRKGKWWVAVAYGKKVTLYSDKACAGSKTQMHEIGHNLGLPHAAEENKEYGDSSGNMGYGPYTDDYRRCYNAPNSWRLGWYKDREKVFTTGSWEGKIYGVAEYGNTNEGDTVLIQIPGIPNDYYVSFNRKLGMTQDTGEGEDQVLVHKKRNPGNKTEGRYSYLLAKLGAGDSYDGPSFKVSVSTIDINTQPGFATVKIEDTEAQSETQVGEFLSMDANQEIE